MQIAIRAPLDPGRPEIGARLSSFALGVALVALGFGTALAVAAAPARHAMHQGDAATLAQVGGSVPLDMPNGAPGDTAVSYTTIAHRGPGRTTVRMYGDVTGALAPHLLITIARGTGEGGTWVADPGPPMFRGTLEGLPGGWSSGLDDGSVWEVGEHHAYRIEVTLLDHRRAQGSPARATFHWEARPVA